MPEGPVVVNNTPLVVLFLLGRFDLFEMLFGQVLVPQQVFDEFLATDRTRRWKAFSAQQNLLVISLADPQRMSDFHDLDSGEAAVLALAQERSARLVIIDERKARRYAKRLHIPLTGSLGMLLLAKANGLLDAIAPSIATLQQSGIYLDSGLIAQALQLADES